MKKTLQLTVICLLLAAAGYAQNVPQGMKYQAVARNLAGNLIGDQEINLKINLVANGNPSVVYYSEVHRVITSSLGLFSLVIGEGKAEKGAFAKVPWSTDEIWMEVSIKDKASAAFAVISNSKLLAVPYALHAGTASELVNSNGDNTMKLAPAPTTTTGTAASAGTWLTAGNLKANPLSDFIGNYDAVDLLIKTANIERIRILANGNVGVAKDFTVTGATALNNKVDITGVTTSTNNTQSTLPTNGALVVAGGAGIGGNLNVGGTTNIGGASTFGGKMAITDETQSTSTTTGALTIAGGAGIVKNLNVGGATDITGATNLQNTLDVTGATHLKNTVTADGITTITNTTVSSTSADGALVVAGGVGIGGDLNVAGATKFGSVGVSSTISAKGLTITDATTSYLATFQNTNDGVGDGIKIKLGRAKSSYTIPAAPSLESSTQFADLLNCKIPETQKVLTLANIVKDDFIETGKTMAGIAVSAGNMIINVINDGLKLPLSIPDITIPAFHISDAIDVTGPINTQLNLPIVLPALSVPEIKFPKLSTPAITIDVPVIPTFTIPGATIINEYQLVPPINLIGATTVMPKLPALTIPALDIPRTTILTSREVMPKLPKIDLTSIGIPEIDISSLAFWGLDINICLDEGSSSPLNNSNEFIRFADKNDAQVGSIRGVSVANWSANYLNPVFFNKLRGAFLSSKADKFHAQYHFKQEISTALASYAKIGVEYSSGNGDYAEWLERTDKTEAISAGDIVSVKGGRITKDLKGAEQVMVVSHAPIMLGNVPEGNKTDLGNSIVFIGQAPVKILGPVTSGDYIIGQVNTPGYGIAKHPNAMTIEDFKFAVGRSWDTDETEGIKMANTVIGVHNSAFLHLIKDLKEKETANDVRLKAIEAKLGMVTPGKKATVTKTKK
jgi:hypothetical protein